MPGIDMDLYVLRIFSPDYQTKANQESIAEGYICATHLYRGAGRKLFCTSYLRGVRSSACRGIWICRGFVVRWRSRVPGWILFYVAVPVQFPGLKIGCPRAHPDSRVYVPQYLR